MNISKYKSIKILAIVFLLFALYTATAKEKNSSDNVSRQDYIIELFNAKIENKNSIFFFLQKNNFFNFENKIFYRKFANKYEITFFLDKNIFKTGDSIYLFGKDIIFYEPNLQNIKSKNFFFF